MEARVIHVYQHRSNCVQITVLATIFIFLGKLLSYMFLHSISFKLIYRFGYFTLKLCACEAFCVTWSRRFTVTLSYSPTQTPTNTLTSTYNQ